jgi:hypothetical protein
MSASKNKPFTLHHCWKVLEHSEKWQLRDQEVPPKKGTFITLDDLKDRMMRRVEETRGNRMKGGWRRTITRRKPRAHA